MNDNQKTPPGGDSDGSLPLFVIRCGIERQVQGIKKYFARFFEGNAVFLAIGSGFLCIPNKAQPTMEVDHIHP